MGRRNEIKTLVDLWKSRSSGFDCVLIRGEPGIGKTSLADRFRRLLALRGTATAWASGHPLEKALPLGVVAQWLEAVGGVTPDVAARPRSAGEARYVRDFAHTTEYETAALGRQRLYSELVRELTANTRPLCLFIDDVQWADDASVGLIGFIRRYEAGSRSMAVLTCRNGKSSGLSEISDAANTLELRPLNLSEVSELCRSRLGTEDRLQDLVRTLHERTGGNPLLLAALLAEDPRVTEADSLPSSIASYVEERLSSVSPAARLVLAALGILKSGTLEALAAITEIGPDLHTSLTELAAAGFIEIVGDEIKPRHGMMAEAALGVVGPAFERQLRGRTARLLQGDSASPAAVAIQYDLAGHRERAYETSLRAADAALELFAFQEAQHFFSIALANAPNEDQRAQVLCQVADMHAWQCEYPAALRVIESCEDLDVSDDVKDVVEAHGTIVRLLANQDSRALTDARAVFSKPEQKISAELRARVALAWRFAAHVKAKSSDVLEAADWTARIAAELPPGKLKLKVRLSAEALHAIHVSAEEAVKNIVPLVAEAAEWPDLLATAYATLGSSRIAVGASREAEQDLLTALEIVEATGNNEPVFMISNNLGVLYQEQGRFEEAAAMFDRALDSQPQEPAPAWVQLTLDNLVTLDYERGAWEQAVQRADVLLRQHGQGTISARSWCCHHSIKGLSYLNMGRRAAAQECLASIEEAKYSSSYSSNDVSYVEIFLARMAELDGRCEAAIARLSERIADYAPRDFFCAARMRVERLRLLIGLSPSSVLEQGVSLRGDLSTACARPLVDRLDSILTRARHPS